MDDIDIYIADGRDIPEKDPNVSYFRCKKIN